MFHLYNDRAIGLRSKYDKTDDREVLLCKAVHENQVETVQILLNMKANPNGTNHEELSAIHIAANFTPAKLTSLDHPETVSRRVDIIKMLLNAKADLNKQSISGHNALLYAVRNNFEEVIPLLLSHQTTRDMTLVTQNMALVTQDMARITLDGDNVLHLAVRHPSLSNFILPLLRLNANPHTRNFAVITRFVCIDFYFFHLEINAHGTCLDFWECASTRDISTIPRHLSRFQCYKRPNTPIKAKLFICDSIYKLIEFIDESKAS